MFSCTRLPLVRDTHDIVRPGCSISRSSRKAGVLASNLSTEVIIVALIGTPFSFSQSERRVLFCQPIRLKIKREKAIAITFSFPALATGSVISLLCCRMHVFPRFQLVVRIPLLTISYTFSRAFHWLCILLI